MDDMMSELKPCPFCGGEAKLYVRSIHGLLFGDYYWVKCEDCNAETASDFEKSVAIEAWNRRANDDNN